MRLRSKVKLFSDFLEQCLRKDSLNMLVIFNYWSAEGLIKRQCSVDTIMRRLFEIQQSPRFKDDEYNTISLS